MKPKIADGLASLSRQLRGNCQKRLTTSAACVADTGCRWSTSNNICGVAEIWAASGCKGWDARDTLS